MRLAPGEREFYARLCDAQVATLEAYSHGTDSGRTIDLVEARSLSTLLAPTGIHHNGLIYPLLQFQVQRLLATRYGDLRDLQYSCWSMTPDQSTCSTCTECRTIAFNLMADGVSPREVGIDVPTLLSAYPVWRPRLEKVDALPIGSRAAGALPSPPSHPPPSHSSRGRRRCFALPAGDTRALARALASLLTDPLRRSELAAGA